MLKSEQIIKTWKCDGLNCQAAEVVSVEDPFFVVRVHKPAVESVAPVEVDFCGACIQAITAPIVVAAVAEMSQA